MRARLIMIAGLLFAVLIPVGLTQAAVAHADDTGSISGTITAASGAAPPQDVLIYVFAPDGSELAFTNTTGTDGTYEIDNLPASAGDTVCFSGLEATGASPTGYQDQCWAGVGWDGSGAEIPAGVTPVPITAGATTSGLDVALLDGGAVAGTVTDAASGNTVGNVWVKVFDTTNTVVASEKTAPDGTFDIDRLVTTGADRYRVCYDTHSSTTGPGGRANGYYQGQCWRNVPWFNRKNPPAQHALVIKGTQPGQTVTGIDAALSPKA